MNLHEDSAAFQVLLASVSRRSGIREDIIEKDYYLTMLLSELASQQDRLPAYFKGGTALYKALGRMIRFSEDIDLTVETQDCTKTQAKCFMRFITKNQHHEMLFLMMLFPSAYLSGIASDPDPVPAEIGNAFLRRYILFSAVAFRENGTLPLLLISISGCSEQRCSVPTV